MKKWIALMLALILALSQATVLAEDVETPVYDHLVVGNTTAFSGHFSTQLWGNNTTDLDVKELLFGYNLIQWEQEQGLFNADPSVVTGMVVYDDPEGNRTYTMVLADDLYYSDGSRITAWDYAFSVLLAVAPEIAEIGGNTNGYESLLGMDAYKKGEAATLAGLTVANDTMLSFTVAKEYRPFFYELGLLRCYALPISVIAPGCQVKDDGQGVYLDKSAGTFTPDNLRKTLLDSETGYVTYPKVTSGPYKLISYDGAVAEFEINEYYKGNFMGVKPTIKYLTYKTVTNEEMIGQLLSGELGLINKAVNTDSIMQGIAGVGTGDVMMGNYARIGYSFISYNCEKPAVGSQAVRQAIAYCLDKDTLVSDYVGNFGLRVDGYYGIGQWMYQMLTGAIEAPLEEPEESATAQEKKEYEDAQLAWEELTMDNIPVYDLDLEAATALLVQDGWTLNREGAAFDPAKDDVRCAQVNGEIVPLDLKLIYPAGNVIAESLPSTFVDNLAQVGIKVTMEPVPMTELLKQYYRQVERDCDMMYLATNFDVVFDPTLNFVPADGDFIGSNYQAINDEKLYELAKDMSMTEPGDVLTYCQKWVAFQEYWMEALPAIPVYSNAYFDFYTNTLQNYIISSSATWSQAIVDAYLSDPAEEEEEEELLEDDEFEILEDDEVIFEEDW
ncbi:MAG: ABC transporter substrate-binding protein [Clostridia bacterium]|nr:ABC transporter substrate-binding protein [Clostridia bacterium]